MLFGVIVDLTLVMERLQGFGDDHGCWLAQIQERLDDLGIRDPCLPHVEAMETRLADALRNGASLFVSPRSPRLQILEGHSGP